MQGGPAGRVLPAVVMLVAACVTPVAARAGGPARGATELAVASAAASDRLDHVSVRLRDTGPGPGDGYALTGAAGDAAEGGIAVLDDIWEQRTRSVGGAAELRGGATITIAASHDAAADRPWSGSWALRDPSAGIEITADVRGEVLRPADGTATWSGPARVRGLDAASGPGRPATAEITVVDGVPDPGDHVVRLRHAGVDRWAAVRVPVEAPAGPLPALFHFPGMFETPAVAELTGRLSSSADRERYLLVVPAHEGIGWQGVAGGEDSPPVDDPGFARALADLVIARFGADPSRLYASGTSNGGLFTQSLACRARDRFAAFATVAGSAPGAGCPGYPRVRPAPVPMVVLHGADDRVLKYAEAAAGAQAWARSAGCAATTVDTPLPDRAPADGTTAVRHEFAGCPAGTPVVLYEIVGGGHTWPGGVGLFPVDVLGRVSGDLDANAVIWSFVSRFRLGN